ncbi:MULTISPECIES: hypothetical protein [unclassified Sinorhizobium]|uniref:hypothetical protein n=1 Tax=unclassified Sinorhizobium TaxID=2613772 RepID=UPI003524E10B
MASFEEIFEMRTRPATLKGIWLRLDNGQHVLEAPCDMLLGNAVVQLAALNEDNFVVDQAAVLFEHGSLDCEVCRKLFQRYGKRLTVAPA